MDKRKERSSWRQQLMPSTQSEWNSKEMRGGCLAISKKKKKSLTCAISVISVCWSGKVSLFLKSSLSHIWQDVATLPHVSRFHRTAAVQGWFPPRCTGLPNCCLIHNCTSGHSIAEPLTYLHFGWCSVPKGGPDNRSSQWSSGNAPVEGKNKRSCEEFSPKVSTNNVEMCLNIRNIFTYFTAHM